MSINHGSIFHTEKLHGQEWGVTWQGDNDYHAKRSTSDGWVSGIWFEYAGKPGTEKFLAVARREISEKWRGE